MSRPWQHGIRVVWVTAAVLTALLSFTGAAQSQQPEGTLQIQDGASVEQVIAALYEAISGPVGQSRDWERLRSLFVPGAHMVPTGRQSDGTGIHVVWTVDEYIERNSDLMVEIGFRESEIGRLTEKVGSIAQVFSAYEAHRDGQTEPLMRGINSFQLWHDGTRWWIVSLIWQQESSENPIPDRFLGSPLHTPM